MNCGSCEDFDFRVFLGGSGLFRHLSYVFICGFQLSIIPFLYVFYACCQLNHGHILCVFALHPAHGIPCFINRVSKHYGTSSVFTLLNVWLCCSNEIHLCKFYMIPCQGRIQWTIVVQPFFCNETLEVPTKNKGDDDLNPLRCSEFVWFLHLEIIVIIAPDRRVGSISRRQERGKENGV